MTSRSLPASVGRPIGWSVKASCSPSLTDADRRRFEPLELTLLLSAALDAFDSRGG
ncbi:hypothetical protein [Nocardia nepalensis]|uniref:hypothetical protein n=1 Tax=Nocardia nepalensis TaxID=3375448 RepID=UPI003B67C331